MICYTESNKILFHNETNYEIDNLYKNVNNGGIMKSRNIKSDLYKNKFHKNRI